MTEQEWLTSTQPAEMLAFLETCERLPGPLWASERKLRLFACAVCRQVWDKLDPRSQRAVEVTERSADDEATEGEVARVALENIGTWVDKDGWCGLPERACGMATSWCIRAGRFETSAIAGATEVSGWLSNEVSPVVQADLLRCINGSPFRPICIKPNPHPHPVGPSFRCYGPAWLTANVMSLATTAYGDCFNAGLPILADAIEDGGCTEASLLDHLRGPGPHARGCWAVDLILGKA